MDDEKLAEFEKWLLEQKSKKSGTGEEETSPGTDERALYDPVHNLQAFRAAVACTDPRIRREALKKLFDRKLRLAGGEK